MEVYGNMVNGEICFLLEIWHFFITIFGGIYGGLVMVNDDFHDVENSDYHLVIWGFPARKMGEPQKSMG